MPTFQVPCSSSPPQPSTPNTSGKHPQGYTSSSYLPAHPSTTPLGPPPSSVGSFTPAEPPPRSLLGSSQISPSQSPLKSSSGSNSQTQPQRNQSSTSPQERVFGKLDRSSRSDSTYGGSNSLGSYFDASNSTQSLGYQNGSRRSGPQFGNSTDSVLGEYGKDNDALHSLAYSSEQVPEKSVPDLESLGTRTWRDSTYSTKWHQLSSTSIFSPANTRGVKRSRTGNMIVRKQSNSPAIANIAQNLAVSSTPAPLVEPDEFILDTEKFSEELNASQSAHIYAQQTAQSKLTKSSEQFSKLWAGYYSSDTSQAPQESDETTTIGPREDAPSLQKAIFLGTLLLQLHHPSPAKGLQAPALDLKRSTLSASICSTGQGDPVIPTSFPKTLIGWLDNYHNPWNVVLSEVETKHPSPPAHYNFWDMVSVLILRGKLGDAICMLEKSDFHYAETAPNDGQVGGYTEKQIDNIRTVVGRAAEVLKRCPGIIEDNWHVTGDEWVFFRHIVRRERDELANFAESLGHESDFSISTESRSLAVSRDSTTHSQNARRAESLVPWTIYRNLRILYGILLGSDTEILTSAQDWVEGTIGLTIWWDGEDENVIPTASLAMTKHSFREARSKSRRLVDIDCQGAYLNRLSQSFQRATDENSQDDFQINSNNAVEVGLACVFENNFEGFMGLLRNWSLPVLEVVAEMAAFGGWFSATISASDNVMKNFDESDLMVLSPYGRQEPSLRRDQIMTEYARALCDRGSMKHHITRSEWEGWQLSIAVLVRIGDDDICRREVDKVLTNVDINSESIMDAILAICWRYGMHERGCTLAEIYADNIIESSESYGTALIYYALGHRWKRVKNIIGLLISMSLIQSAAFPPARALDAKLRSLLYNPSSELQQVFARDGQAGEILKSSFTGYATLRKFYDLRDQVTESVKEKNGTVPLDLRRREALPALLAVIKSSSDNVAGGLVDKSKEPAVPLDGLLILLGESMVFTHEHNNLNLDESWTILKAIEDLQTVPRQTYDLCEESFQSTLASYHGRAVSSSPQRLLKTMSSMTSASSFSLVGSSMLDVQSFDSQDSLDVLTDKFDVAARGWDWRKGIAKGAKGEDVLRVLRLGMTRSIARYWMEDGGKIPAVQARN